MNIKHAAIHIPSFSSTYPAVTLKSPGTIRRLEENTVRVADVGVKGSPTYLPRRIPHYFSGRSIFLRILIRRPGISVRACLVISHRVRRKPDFLGRNKFSPATQTLFLDTSQRLNRRRNNLVFVG